jgi:hypothetical protein
MALATNYEQVTYNSPDGAQIGKGSTEKLGFWGATPVVRRSGATQAALTVTATTTGGVFGFTSTTQFSALMAQVEELRAALVQYGMLAGS